MTPILMKLLVTLGCITLSVWIVYMSVNGDSRSSIKSKIEAILKVTIIVMLIMMLVNFIAIVWSI